MNLYVVERRGGVRVGQRTAMVVRERTGEDARVLAQRNAGKEGAEAWARGKVDVTRIPTSGKAAVILAAHEPSSLVTSVRRMRMPMTRRGMLATMAQVAMA